MATLHALAHDSPMTPAWKRITGKTLGERLREARDGAELSQDEVGARIGKNGQTVWRWEHDINEPGATTIAKLSTIYGIPPHELLGWTPQATAAMHPELRRFLAGPEGEKLTEEERTALVTMAIPSGVEPTYKMYSLFLAAIQAGRPADVAAESARVTAEAERRAKERGWKILDDDEPPRPRRRRN